jgi:uncharacterized membrane protein
LTDINPKSKIQTTNKQKIEIKNNLKLENKVVQTSKQLTSDIENTCTKHIFYVCIVLSNWPSVLG